MGKLWESREAADSMGKTVRRRISRAEPQTKNERELTIEDARNQHRRDHEGAQLRKKFSPFFVREKRGVKKFFGASGHDRADSDKGYFVLSLYLKFKREGKIP